MIEFTLYVFNKKGGKLIKGLDCKIGKGMLGLYALRHITKSRVGIIVDPANQIYSVFIGRENKQCSMSRYEDTGILDYLELYMIDDTHIDTGKLIKKYAEV